MSKERLRCHYCKREVPEELERLIRRYEGIYGEVAIVVCEDCMNKLKKAKFN